jgi:TnpA family transposase
MGQREIARYYTLSDDDLKRIRRHRRDHNRLGYAVQLGLLRYPGWPFRPADALPQPMITYIAAQLGVGPKLIKEYSTTRDTTRREHLAQVQREFGFTSFTAEVRDELAQWLLPIALRDERAMALVSGLLDEMRTRKIVLPALSTVEGIVVDTLSLSPKR